MFASLKTEVLVVTPELAREWLSTRNLSNRKIQKAVVRKYARMMLQGDWKLTGEPIIFDDAGHLKNGQHRLEACLHSGQSFTSLIVSGVIPETYEVMDQGQRRSLQDVLRSQGHKDVAALAAAINWLWKWENGQIQHKGAGASISDALRLFSKTPDLINSVAVVLPLSKGPLHFYVSVAAPFHYKVTQLWPEEAANFFLKVKHGTDLSEGSIVLLFRKWLENTSKERGRIKPTTYLAIAIKAFNLFIKGEGVQRLLWQPGRGESFPDLLKPDDPSVKTYVNGSSGLELTKARFLTSVKA